MNRLKFFVFLIFLLSFALAPVHSFAQRVITPPISPSGVMTPVIVKPPTMNSERYIIYQPKASSPDLRVITIPPPPREISETQDGRGGDCLKKCLYKCPVGDNQCSSLCKNACD